MLPGLGKLAVEGVAARLSPDPEEAGKATLGYLRSRHYLDKSGALDRLKMRSGPAG